MSTVTLDPRTGNAEGSFGSRAVIAAMRSMVSPFSAIGFRGYSRACVALADAFAPGLEVEVALNADTRFAFPAADSYWVRLVTDQFPYESEIERVFRRFADRPFTLLDCGANYGYWSALVTSAEFGSHKAVAVEASSHTMKRLRRNAALNGDRFTSVHRAISDKAGAIVRLGGESHASRSIIGATTGEEVATTTIDEIAAQHCPTGPIIIKLDVEGVEVKALHGASTTMTREPLLLYEDHGNDPSCAPSRYLLENGWAVYNLEGAQPLRVVDVTEVAALKKDARKGYNFAAERGSRWLQA